MFQSFAPGADVEIEKAYISCEALYQLQDEIRLRYEDKVLASGPSPEAQVAAQLALHAVKLCRGIEALAKAGEHSMAMTMMRTVEENASNLFFILYAGPKVLPNISTELASQFMAFRKKQHLKLGDRSKDEYLRKYRLPPCLRPQWMNEVSHTQFIMKMSKMETEAKKADSLFGFTDRQLSWHKWGLFKRTKAVIEHLPSPLFDHTRSIWQSSHDTYDIYNALVHASPFLFDGDDRPLKKGFTKPEAISSHFNNRCTFASQFAAACWVAVADLFGEADQVITRQATIQLTMIDEIVKKHRIDK